jgi:hypothetical protein
MQMDDSVPELQSNLADESEPNEQQPLKEEIAILRSDFQSRLLTANLRTEAVRAGMIDLDGLKLVDLADVRLDENDRVVGGRKIMADLRRNKPWLFRVASTSSAARSTKNCDGYDGSRVHRCPNRCHKIPNLTVHCLRHRPRF